MLYVARDPAGRIIAAYPTPTDNAVEAVPAEHPDVLQFITTRTRQEELASLDKDFIRVIEDMIELLIAKQVILFTDLPPKVQEKMLLRKETRQQLHIAGIVGLEDDTIRL